jgi:hypothetical protein
MRKERREMRVWVITNQNKFAKTTQPPHKPLVEMKLHRPPTHIK